MNPAKTGYRFDLLDRDLAVRDDHGLLKDHLAQMGPYDSRHEAVGMKAVLERRLEPTGEPDEYDYEVRAWDSMFREAPEIECDYCGYVADYRPLVGWNFVLATDDDPHDGGRFCCGECCARWAYRDSDRPYPDHV